MTLRTHVCIKTISLIAALCASTFAFAGDPVTDAMVTANAPYRMALYKTNGISQTEALQAVTQARQAWNQFSLQYAAKPAAPYDRDAAFAKSVAAVSAVYEKALAEVNANDIKLAHDTLEAVRDITAEMRQRNQVVVFSDHMNAYHSQMETMMSQGHTALSQPKGLLHMTAQTGALSYLAKQLGLQASENLSKNPEFTSLMNAVNQSVSQLEAAVLNQDVAATKEAISKLKGPYSKLFAKFG